MQLNRSAQIILLIGIVLGVLMFVPIKPKSKMDLEFKKQGVVHIDSPEGKSRVRFDIELADTPEKQETGLMHRTSLEKNQGMFFMMEEQEVHNFWMLDTYIPLDIIYADSLKEVVFIAKATEPESQEPITSFTPSLYILEVNAGLCDRYGISVGDRIRYDLE